MLCLGSDGEGQDEELRREVRSCSLYSVSQSVQFSSSPPLLCSQSSSSPRLLLPSAYVICRHTTSSCDLNPDPDSCSHTPLLTQVRDSPAGLCFLFSHFPSCSHSLPAAVCAARAAGTPVLSYFRMHPLTSCTQWLCTCSTHSACRERG